jgi:dolichol-phosphate mannosyltransferase
MKKSSLSVILPCYNEKSNIDYLISEFESADHNSYISRIIFVDDDSPDGTAEYVKKISSKKFDVLCLHRIHRQGLSSAVIEGTLLAATKYVAVMDSDGQHDPRDLIAMFEQMHVHNCQFIIGSRFLNQALIENHAGIRAFISHVGNLIANKVLKRDLTDPLTGFFIFDRSLFKDSIRNIRPSGFKILLDLLYQLKNKQIKLEEFPIKFRIRHLGESKLNSRALIEFVDQIAGFITGNLLPDKMFIFVLVGGTGVVINLSILYLLFFPAHWDFQHAQITATLISMISNFAVNNEITFHKNKRSGLGWFKGLGAFMLICSLGAFANVGVAGYLFNEGKVWWAAALVGILIGTVFNFSLSKFYIWKK